MSNWLTALCAIIVACIPYSVSFSKRAKRKAALEEGLSRIEFWSKWLNAVTGSTGAVQSERDSTRAHDEIVKAADDVSKALALPAKGKKHLPLWRRAFFLYWPDDFLSSLVCLYPYISVYLIFRLAIAMLKVHKFYSQFHSPLSSAFEAGQQVVILLILGATLGLQWWLFVDQDGRK